MKYCIKISNWETDRTEEPKNDIIYDSEDDVIKAMFGVAYDLSKQLSGTLEIGRNLYGETIFEINKPDCCKALRTVYYTQYNEQEVHMIIVYGNNPQDLDTCKPIKLKTMAEYQDYKARFTHVRILNDQEAL